jgi:cob(I)alamin adenosyltransferase
LHGGTLQTIVAREFSVLHEEIAMSEDTPPVSTGSGDDGTTTLLGGGRQAKDDERIALLGDIDE